MFILAQHKENNKKNRSLLYRNKGDPDQTEHLYRLIRVLLYSFIYFTVTVDTMSGKIRGHLRRLEMLTEIPVAP